jgi:tetratricopeptide (TPR) repeat protein
VSKWSSKKNNRIIVTKKRPPVRYLFTVIFLLSHSLLAHGEFHEIIEIKNKAIIKEPKNPSLYIERALIYEQHEKYEEALTDLAKAESLKSDLTDFHFYKGRIFFANGKADKALTFLNLSLAKQPKKSSTLQLRGKIFTQLKNYPAACADLDAVVKLSNDLKPLQVLEQAEVHVLNPNTGVLVALKHLDSGLQKLGSVISLHNQKLLLLVRQEMYTEAAAEIEPILKIVNRQEMWLLKRAGFYLKVNKSSLAMQDLKHCIAILEGLPDVLKKRKINQRIREKAETLLKSLN